MPRRGETGRTVLGDARSARLLAHELNNIALPLKGFVELAEDAPGDAEALRECFQEIRAGSRRLAELARDLGALGQDEPSMRVTTLADCLPSTARGPALSGNAAVRVRADPGLLRQSLTLLLEALAANAIVAAMQTPARPMRRCHGCGARLSHANHLLLHVQVSRASLLRALRDPLDDSLRLSPTQRVRIAASTRQLHVAGAHFFTGDADVTIALPLAARRKT